MCYDYLRACGNDVIDMNCDYLPTSTSDIECYDKTVKCSSPYSTVQDGKVLIIYKAERTYSAEVSCNEWFRLEGNSSISCLHSGKWSSKLPVCLPIAAEPTHRSLSWILVLMTVFILFFMAIVFLIIAVIYRMRFKVPGKIRLHKEQVQIDIGLKEIDDPLLLYRKEKDPVKIDSVRRRVKSV